MKCDNSLNSSALAIDDQFRKKNIFIDLKERQKRENDKQIESHLTKTSIDINDGINAIKDIGEKIVKQEVLDTNDYLGTGLILVGFSAVGLIIYELNKI